MLGCKLVRYNNERQHIWIYGIVLFYGLRFTILGAHKQRSASVELAVRVLWWELTLGNIIWDTALEAT